MERVDAADWGRIRAELDAIGGALIGPLLDDEEAAEIDALYGDDSRFRPTVDMARHRFGERESRAAAEPLPDVVNQLRRALYPKLLPVARDWWAKLGRS